MCDKAVNICFFAFDFIPNQYKTQEIYDIIVSLYPFLMTYCPDKCKTQKICDEAVDDCLVALKCIPDCFVTSKMVNALHANKNILFYNKDFNKVIFIANQKHILAVDLEKVSLNNFDEDDLDRIIHIRFGLALYIQKMQST